nr:hypothetical protein [uncultured Thiocystis sp.]
MHPGRVTADFIETQHPHPDPEPGADEVGHEEPPPGHMHAAGHQAVQLPGAVEEAPDEDEPDPEAAEKVVELTD